MNTPDNHYPDETDYSDDPDEIDELPLESAAKKSVEGEQTADAELYSKLADTEEQLLRARAEIENVRSRARREYEDLLRYREMDLLRDILPVLDNVERAIEASEKTADLEGLRAGFKLTAKQIEKILDTHGCKTIATDRVEFDPSVHEAILQQPAANAPPGSVIGVASRGYLLHDRVVRPAQVIVAAGD